MSAISSTNRIVKSVDVLDEHCYLIRKALNLDEQIALFNDIQRRDHNSSKVNKHKALYPSPRTVQLGEQKTKIKFSGGNDDGSLYSQLVDNANTAIILAETKPTIDLPNYKSITLSAIEYEAAKHTLTEHIDHDDSFVYLLSIGCATNFVIKGPHMATKSTIQMASGDLIVFDASTTGNILHGIASIESGETCPSELANQFPVLENHRYGIQLRVRF